MTYAVIKTGGKQYKVTEGQVVTVEKLEHESDSISFDQVLLVGDDEKAMIGKPLVKGAKVTATVIGEGKAAKKMVFRYKSKTRYHKKKGHRQPFTKVKITKITA